MSNELEERIIELEVRTSYQERMLSELDEVVRTFAERVEELGAEVTRLRASVEEEAAEIGPADDPPPHY